MTSDKHSSYQSASGESFAAEPEDWGQMHKVLTRDLDRIEKECRRIKDRPWPQHVTFSFGGTFVSVGIAGVIEIANAPKSGVPAIDWVLLAVGLVGSAASFGCGMMFRHHFRDDIDTLAEEVRNLRY